MEFKRTRVITMLVSRRKLLSCSLLIASSLSVFSNASQYFEKNSHHSFVKSCWPKNAEKFDVAASDYFQTESRDEAWAGLIERRLSEAFQSTGRPAVSGNCAATVCRFISEENTTNELPSHEWQLINRELNKNNSAGNGGRVVDVYYFRNGKVHKLYLFSLDRPTGWERYLAEKLPQCTDSPSAQNQ